MPLNLLPTLLLSIMVVGYSPGPANLFSLSCALKYGKKRSLVMWRGLLCGFSTAIVLVMALLHLLGPVFGPYFGVLKYAGAAYMAYLAVKLFTNRGGKTVDNDGTCTFLSGFIVQFTNAKMLLFELSVFSSFVLPYSSQFIDMLKVAILLLVAGPCANLVWLLAGGVIRQLYARHQRLADALMSASLLLCAVLILL